MQTPSLAAASLFVAAISISGCRQDSTRQPMPEALSTTSEAAPTPEPGQGRPEHDDLLALCRSGDATPMRIKAFLELGADVNARDQYGNTPLLCVAVLNQDPRVLEILIDAGADVNAGDKTGQTAFYLAASFNKNPAVVTVLIEAGADVNAKSQSDWTPLHGAAAYNPNPEFISLLTRAGADVNARSTTLEWTPLYMAAGTNPDPKVLTALIKAGADVNAKDVSGVTPLDFAEDMGMNENVRALRAAGGERGEDL